MNNRYKIVITGKSIYREIEIAPETRQVRVGTGVDCDVRLHRDMFFGAIELLFTKNENKWSVLCSDNIYLSVGDIRKLMTKQLTHGDEFTVKYQESDNEVFFVSFLIDFDNGKRHYERAINMSASRSVSIGSDASCDIVLGSLYVKNEQIRLSASGDGYILSVERSAYGVYLNGNKVVGRAELKNSDFIAVADFVFYIKDSILWTEMRDDMYIKSLCFSDYPDKNDYPKFNRNTRVKTLINDEKIELLDPPTKPQKPKNNLMQRLLPSLGMFVASGIMAAMGTATMLIFSGISALMSIIMAIYNIREGNKEYEQKSAERIEKYEAYIDTKREEIEKARNEEQSCLEDIYISAERELNELGEFSSDLFDRRKEDEDFLCVRLGTGDVESARAVNYKKQERLELEDELQQVPEQIYEEYRYVHKAPIVCDLKSVNAIGVTGNAENRFDMLKNMVIDIAARHYYTEVKMIFIANEKNRDKIKWLRMLPHVYNEQIGIRNIVVDDESRNIIFEYLYKELSAREQSKTAQAHLVVFFYDEYGFKSHPISRFTDKAEELGVTFVFFGKAKSDIAQGCGFIIELQSGETGRLVDVSDRSKTSEFTYRAVSDTDAERIVNFLAPVYTEEISLEGSLTKSYSMFEMLNIIAVDDMDLRSRWSKSQVYKSMAAPVGISKSGIVELDLHDKAHGPHGLVAGTTGSGKSEILQTYILSMATLFHPYEVAFVIIDFKGGGMVNQFKELPHLLGAITNIDGREINRSLKSIKAELQKRQRLFAAAGVNHIDKYIKKYKAGEVAEALPHLIIIVDEFAELKAEQPDFMKELISAARIGRSLGVHLILATQKPSGQVNEQIWSNSRFKLCLKVQSKEDSNEVIKSPLAAEIKEPGRAYLQVGNNEIFELFQSAYSGVPEKSEDSGVKEFSIYSLTDSGRRVPVYSRRKEKNGDGSATQLDAIVRYVADYCREIKLKKLPNICLPTLPKVINFPKAFENTGGIKAAIGIYDDPDNQYQGVYEIDVCSQNVMIIGSAQSGKTNALSCIIRNLASRYTPEEVNIYIIDFAAMTLKLFEPMAHVGGVVTSSEDEKLKNLIKLLYAEIDVRKEKLVSIGVSSFAAYREAGKTDLPQIVLLIDNLTALKELYFKDDDEILDLCRDGLSVGISIVIANSQTSGIGYRYLSNFANRIALFCNDTGEYSSLFDHCRERIEDIHGRCLIDVDKSHLECQLFHAFGGEKEIDRANEIKAFISTVNRKYRGKKAKLIPTIPQVLTASFVEENYFAFMQDEYSMVLGLDYGNVSPLAVQINGMGAVAVSGRAGSGKHNFIRYFVNMLEKMYPDKTSVYIVDGISKRLAELADCPNVASYDFLAARAVGIVKDIEQQLRVRYDSLASGERDSIDGEKLIVLVLNSPDAIEAICAEPAALNAYKNIVGKYKSMNVFVLVGSYENVNVSYSAPEIIKKLKDARQFLFFDDLASLKIIDLPLAVMRNFKKPIERGDCYFISDNECRKLKTAINK